MSLSLIITAYNQERYLQDCLDSVLKQDYQPLEIIYFDDGSSDKSLKIAKDFSQDNPELNIKIIESFHVGRVPALIEAHKYVSSDYVGWVDGDDILAPTAASDSIHALENTLTAGASYSQYECIDSQGKVVSCKKRYRIPYSKNRLLKSFITFHFRVIETQLFWECGGINPEIKLAPDYDLCLRLSEITNFVYLPKVLYFYRRHGNSISAKRREEQAYWSKLAARLAKERRNNQFAV